MSWQTKFYIVCAVIAIVMIAISIYFARDLRKLGQWEREDAREDARYEAECREAELRHLIRHEIELLRSDKS